MPIYEYYCAPCHTIYNFFSRRINTDKIPTCPKCDKKDLERQVSLFSFSKGREEQNDEDMFSGMDESRMEQALMSMASEIEGADEDDPRQAAKMMRKLYDATGLKFTPAIEEAISRMESGEDPEKIETELGDELEDGDPFLAKPHQHIDDLRRKYLPPSIDETLYDL